MVCFLPFLSYVCYDVFFCVFVRFLMFFILPLFVLFLHIPFLFLLSSFPLPLLFYFYFCLSVFFVRLLLLFFSFPKILFLMVFFDPFPPFHALSPLTAQAGWVREAGRLGGESGEAGTGDDPQSQPPREQGSQPLSSAPNGKPSANEGWIRGATVGVGCIYSIMS